jgi:superfamily II DNA/RNA helicase
VILDLAKIHGTKKLLQANDLRTAIGGRMDALDDGQRVYWVCPLVEESELSDLAAAEDRFKALRKRFGPLVDLVHGKMRGPDKDEAMRKFASGETRLLVSTTVIEVGVDVPNATVMVIEHAERFGLAQLHQLRGRVGRGAAASTCVLLGHGRLSEVARERLDTMVRTEDGFVIAEKDLEIRGPGDFFGTRQSGMPSHRSYHSVNSAPSSSCSGQRTSHAFQTSGKARMGGGPGLVWRQSKADTGSTFASMMLGFSAPPQMTSTRVRRRTSELSGALSSIRSSGTAWGRSALVRRTTAR